MLNLTIDLILDSQTNVMN